MHLPIDVDLGDIHPWAASLTAAIELVGEGKAPSFIYFSDSSQELKHVSKDLKLAYKNKIPFWIAYPLSSANDNVTTEKKVLKRMKKLGVKSRAEEIIDRNWSGIYFSKSKIK